MLVKGLKLSLSSYPNVRKVSGELVTVSSRIVGDSGCGHWSPSPGLESQPYNLLAL